jgi:hypothetical protein
MSPIKEKVKIFNPSFGDYNLANPTSDQKDDKKPNGF